MRKIAFLGSRDWQRQDEVKQRVTNCYAEHGQFILVSGGAKGASLAAEQTGIEMGIPVISFRPVKIAGTLDTEDSYGVDEWRLFRGAGQIIMHREPTWGDYGSAAAYRSLLIAGRADEAVAFWDGKSRGTSDEIDFFAALKKPCEVVTL